MSLSRNYLGPNPRLPSGKNLSNVGGNKRNESGITTRPPITGVDINHVKNNVIPLKPET